MTERLQLRDWLLALLERNQTPGLEWQDRDQKIFSISWRHGRKKGWKSETDSQLFKEWAIYKKRYKPGNDKKNAKLWKSRFRCALNALNDVRELKTLSKTKGEDPKKIYQFAQKQPVVTVKRRRFPREVDNHPKSLLMDKPRFADFDFNEEEELCCNKIDTQQRKMEQPGFHGMCTDYQYMNSEGLGYIFYQTSQELYKFSDLFCSLDEDDMDAHKTIEEFLGPKCHM